MRKPIEKITKVELNSYNPFTLESTLDSNIITLNKKVNELVDEVNKLLEEVRSLKNQTNEV